MKYLAAEQGKVISDVRHLVGAWIEMSGLCFIVEFFSVRPLVGAWIEITPLRISDIQKPVRPPCGGVD